MADELSRLLTSLSLESYLPTFREEEINDVQLLKSMGEEMLRESMEELGMEGAHIQKLAVAVFGGGAAADEDDDIALEDNANEDDDLALEENADEDGGLELEENMVEAPGAASSAPPAAPPAAPEPMASPPATPAISDASKKAAERVKAQGNDALKQGKYSEAAALYGQAIGLDPTNSVYYSNRSSAFASLSRFDRALVDADKCVELRPEWAKSHLRRGGALSGLKRHEDAKHAFAAALACEPSNAQIKALLEAATETAADCAGLADELFDWMQELNDRVPPNPFYERGLELQDDAPMTIDYRIALQEALDDVSEQEGLPLLRSSSGAALIVEQVCGTNFEKMVLVARRSAQGASQPVLKGAAKKVAIKLWHMKRDWRDEGDDDDAIAERMQRRATAEHTRIRQLSGCKHWLQLVADVAAEKEARIGGEQYAAIFLEHFPGKDLTELLTPMRPPREGKGGRVQAVGDDDDDDDDDDDMDDDEEEEGVAEAWEEAKRTYTPEKLNEELGLIKMIALGSLRAMKEANEAGFRFEPDGSEGPFLGDVLVLDGKVKFVDTEPLGEYEEGDDRRFTAEPLVYSPVGEFIRSWWVGTAAKINMKTGELCPNKRFQDVLNSFGTLNWLLFKWEPKNLHGDEIIHLLTHGPEAQRAAPDPTLEAHWENLMNRAFTMLGPRRFDEIKEINELMQKQEIAGKDIVTRSRYCFGREFEGLHEEYLGLLKKLGVKLK